MPVYKWQDFPENGVNAGASARVLTGERVQVLRVEFAAGIDYAPHSHPHEQVIIVQQGRFELLLNGERQVVSEGDVIHVPPGIPHGVRLFGERAVTLEVFSPPRTNLSHDRPE